MSKETIKSHFIEAQSMLAEFVKNDANFELIEQAAKAIIASINNNGKVISCGNGGSMTDAMHFAEEMTGRFRENRKSLPAIAISDIAHVSCVSNDFGYDFVFSRFLESFGNKGDVLVAISTSGNSNNVINAINTAKEKGMFIIGLTGKDGGEIANLVDIEIRTPKSKWADRVQEIHIKIIHSLIDYIERNIS